MSAGQKKKGSVAESEFDAEKEFFRRIIDILDDLIVAVDKSGKVVFVNTALERALSLPAGEATGRSVFEMVSQRDRSLLEKLLFGSKPEEKSTIDSIRFINANGREKSFRGAVKPLPGSSADDRNLVFFLEDRDEAKQSLDHRNYEERLRSIGLTLSKITHEVRNPLAAIQASAEFLRRHWDADEESKLEVVGLVADEVNRVNNILTQFLHLRRIPTPRLMETDIEIVVGNVLKSIDKFLRKRPEISVERRIESASFFLDPDLLTQVLWNLLNNAVEAINKEGKIQIVGSLPGANDRYELVIIDDGCGMDSEQQRRAFEPFYTGKTTGTGLGLAIVKLNVEAMGGDVSINSSLGAGTRVSIRLPLKGESR